MNKESRPKEKNFMKYIAATLMFASFIGICVALMGMCLEVIDFRISTVLLTISVFSGWVSAECIDIMEDPNK